MAKNSANFTKYSPLHPRKKVLFTSLFTISLFVVGFFNMKENLHGLQIRANYREELILGMIPLNM